VSARAAWASSALPAVIVPDALGAAAAAEARARLEHAEYKRWTRLDQASYAWAAPDEPALRALLEAVAGVASAVTGRSLAAKPSEARVIRLDPGDYVLQRHDVVHEDRPVEATLDLSPAPVPDADLQYRHRGQLFFAFPTTPGALCLVERGPTVMCNHRYVKRIHAGARVVRLVALLRDVTAS
jgi:hypothetical protein